MTLVRKDPLIRKPTPERLRLKGPVPVRFFSSARRQAAFCNRVAGLSDRRSASGSAALMRNVLRAVLTIMMFVPLAAFAQTNPVDLTTVFVDGGVTIDRLLVYQIGGIVLIRGRTDKPDMAAEAGRFASSRGYKRVANMIEINTAIGDNGIELLARNRLERARELADCRFQLNSVGGVISLRGQIASEFQRDFAIRLLRRIDGVKSVRSTLTTGSARRLG